MSSPRQRVASVPNLLAGGLFAAFGVAALWLGRRYTVGSASEMGPGYFPRALGLLLLALGLAIALRALRQPGPAARRFAGGPLLWLVGSVLLFALLLDRIGLSLAGVLLVAGVRKAQPRLRWTETLLLAVGLTLASVLIFGYGLGVPFRIWPWGDT